jgi:hypothetical protein
MNGFKLMRFAKYKEAMASESLNVMNTRLIGSVCGNPILGRAVDMIEYDVANRIMGQLPTSLTGAAVTGGCVS